MFQCWELLSLTLLSSSVPHLSKLKENTRWLAPLVPAGNSNHSSSPTPHHHKNPSQSPFPALLSHFRTCLGTSLLSLESFIIWAIKFFTPSWRCVCGVCMCGHQWTSKANVGGGWGWGSILFLWSGPNSELYHNKAVIKNERGDEEEHIYSAHRIRLSSSNKITGENSTTKLL